MGSTWNDDDELRNSIRSKKPIMPESENPPPFWVGVAIVAGVIGFFVAVITFSILAMIR